MDKPEPGKLYALTGGPEDAALSNGNTWEVRTCPKCGCGDGTNGHAAGCNDGRGWYDRV